YKDFSEDIALSSNQTLETPIDYFILSARYSGSYFGKSDNTRFELGVNFSTRGAGNTLEEFESKRYKANPNFYYLSSSIKYNKKYFNALNFVIRSRAQFTTQALISNEQFNVGGVDTVRGYLSSAAAAEKGLQASIELQSLNLARYLGYASHQLNAFIFGDSARLWKVDPLPEETTRFFLLSAGAGLNYNYKNHASASLTVAAPLWNKGLSFNEEALVHFSLRTSF
ncbi:MAG: ShlB/FhaC/HecB family hemolysin secretion/activation protein, partial [Gammaproteobacteria bacterium]|nr:ShlB/FhaC/HecB family hemolysin secretion/activation protein [Gammaproteobacteria bacterium]